MASALSSALDCLLSNEDNSDLEEALPPLLTAYNKLTKIDEATILSDAAPLHEDGQYQQVIDLVSSRVDHYELHPPLLALVASSQTALQRPADALASYRKLVYLRPQEAAAHYNLGNAYLAVRDLRAAAESYRSALKLKPDHGRAWNNLANLIAASHDYSRAIAMYDRAIAADASWADPHNNKGNCHLNLGQIPEAIASYSRAQLLQPDNVDALVNLATAYSRAGSTEEAASHYRRALALNSLQPAVHRMLSALTKYSPGDPHIAEVESLLERGELNNDARSNLLHALAKMMADSGRYQEAFEAYRESGFLRKSALEYTYDRDARVFHKLIDNAPNLITTTLTPSVDELDTTPIFIVGMPRSGTTLVEQILSAHSEVFGAGELTDVEVWGSGIALSSDRVSKENLNQFRIKYLDKCAKLASGARYATDKMPQNFRFLPLILAAIPEAKVLHVRRDPRATCWSNFIQYFTATGMGYSYDIEDVVRYFNDYSNMMEVWGQLLNGRYSEVDYEELVTRPEDSIKNLLTVCGLSHERSCFHPEKNKRAIATASVRQVRNKIYRGSSGAWRKYEEYLAPYFERLTRLD